MIFDMFDQARFQESRKISTSELMDERLEYVCEVDELGYGTYWSSEHHPVASHPVTIPNLFLAAAARATARIRLGVMCTVLPLHHPIRVAEETALLDHLSHGRFSLGVGRGVGKHEFDKWAMPMEDTQEIFDEHLRALEVLFGGAGPKSFEGRYYRFRDFELMPSEWVQRPHVPIYVASVSASSLRMAARKRLPIVSIFKTLDDEASFAASYRSAWREFHGERQPPVIGTSKIILVAETDSEARNRMKGPLTAQMARFIKGGVPTLEEYEHTKGLDKAYDRATYRRLVDQFEERSFEQLVRDGLVIAGSPDTCIRMIGEIEAAGYGRFVLSPFIGEMSLEYSYETTRRFAEQILPRFGVRDRPAA